MRYDTYVQKKFCVNYAYVWQLLFSEKAKLIYGNKLTSWLKVSVMSFKTNKKTKYSTVNCLLYNGIQMTFLITWHNDYSQGSEPDHLIWCLIHYWLVTVPHTDLLWTHSLTHQLSTGVFYGFIDLHRLSELQEFPIDLEPYVKKLMNSRRRVMLVNNILQNAQVLTEHKQINKRRGKILTFWIQLHFSPTDQFTIQLNWAEKKNRSDCPGQVNFVLGKVKIEVQWPNGQEKLASIILWVWMKC